MQIPHKLNMSCNLIGEVYFFLLVKMYAPLRMLCLFRARLRFNLCGSNGGYVFRYAASVAYLLFFINPKEKTMKSHFKKSRYLFFRYLRIPWVPLRQDKKKTVCNKETVCIAKLAMPFETRTYAYTLICLWCFVHYRKPKIRKIRKENKNVFRKRKIFNCILFSILTLGIYYIYWEHLLVKILVPFKRTIKAVPGKWCAFCLFPSIHCFGGLAEVRS